MALAAATQWEIRQTATANMLNGGGFVAGASGTDYSQQDAAQYNFTDLASTNGTNATPQVTSVSHSFVATDVGNIMHITAGTSWTAGWYQIVSVAGGAATLDKAVGSAATLSAGTYYVGGALSLNSALDNSFATSVVAGNTVWIKYNASAIALGTSMNFTPGGAGSNILIQGYNTTRGDNPSGSNRPTINVGNVSTFTPGGRSQVANIIVTGTNANVFTVGANSTITNVKAINTSTTAGRVALNCSSLYTVVLNSEAISYRGNAVTVGNAVMLYGCYIHDSNTGIAASTGSEVVIKNCVIESNVTSAITFSSSASSLQLLEGNTLFGSLGQTGTGIIIPSGMTWINLFNNIISGFATGITDANGAGNSYGDYNDLYNNGTNYVGFTVGANSKTLNPQFTNVGQLTGTHATTSGFVLTDSTQNFNTVVDNRDFCYIVSGTGITAGQYLITSHTTTTITLDLAPGTSAVTDKSYQITTGRNYQIGRNLINDQYPQAFPANIFTSYGELGALQRNTDADYTDPGIANVRNGTTYSYQAATLTGNVILPTVSQVKIGVAYDTLSSQTGTYDGSDRWTDPGIANVGNGIAYKANSVTNNRTGNVVLPATSDVKSGVTFGSLSSQVGTYDPITGNYTDPGVTNVKLATTYRFAGITETGTYDPITGNYTDPGIANVRTGINYKFAGASLSGNYTAVSNEFLRESLAVDFATNLLSGPLWVSLSGITTVGLGTASYTILNIDGTTTGVTQSGLTAAASGLFFITPVDVSALVGVGKQYILQISITVDSTLYTDYQPISLDNSISMINVNAAVTKNIVISEI